MGSVTINRYRRQFVCRCPVNDQRIFYSLTIETPSQIMVEHINETVEGFESAFHEGLADDLFARFGGTQRLIAHHHGVDIETVRS